MVTGFLCNRTALISSSVTGPVAALGATLEEGDAPFGRTLLFAVDGVSSFPGLASCTGEEKKISNNMVRERNNPSLENQEVGLIVVSKT